MYDADCDAQWHENMRRTDFCVTQGHPDCTCGKYGCEGAKPMGK